MFGASSELASVMEIGFIQRRQTPAHYTALTSAPLASCPRADYLQIGDIGNIVERMNEVTLCRDSQYWDG